MLLFLLQAACLLLFNTAFASAHLSTYFKEYNGPFVQHELSGGLSGAKNYKVSVDAKDYVLRLLNPKLALCKRQSEIVAATFAGEFGIGPSIVYTAPDFSAMIMHFVQGETLTPQLFEQQDMLALFLQTIKRLHSATGGFPDNGTNFEKMTKRLENLKAGDIPFPEQEVSEALEKLKQYEKMFSEIPKVPCHNDLSALNVIFDGSEFKLIDWTDAGMGYAYNDLGFFLLLNRIPSHKDFEVLSLYSEQVPNDRDLEYLRIMRKVNTLRIFEANFPAFEPPIHEQELRTARQIQIKEMLQDENLPQIDYFFELHMQGKLCGNDLLIAFSLSALKSFLN